MDKCSIDDCSGVHFKRGYCNKHFQRWYRRGNPETAQRTTVGMSKTEKLNFYTVKTDGCWAWTGTKTPEGYGQVFVNGTRVYAHRLSYEINKGEISLGMCICHKCDNPECTNPEHLFIGTHKDNYIDMVMKKRQTNVRGSKHWNAKLKESDVIEIRELLKDGKRLKEIGLIYGVSKETVCGIKTGYAWSWLK